MKKLTFLIATLLGGNLLAQTIPTLTQATSVPVAGTGYEVYTTTSASLNVTHGGANETWDFSNLSGSTVVVNYSTDANSNNPGVFPNCNLAEESSVVENYLNSSATGLGYVGQITQGVSITYSDMAEILKFPITYSNTFNETLAGETTVPVIGLIQGTGTSTIEADGHGELITSYGTISGVLRIHVSQVINFSVIGQVTNDLYLWYDEHNKVPLAQYTIFNAPGAGQYVEVSTVLTETDLDPGTVTSVEEPLATRMISISPNPAQNHIVIGDAPIGAELHILSISGQVLVSQTINSTQEIVDISALPQGMYFVKTGEVISQFIK